MWQITTEFVPAWAISAMRGLGLVDLPDGEVVLDPVDAALGEEQRGPEPDPVGELAHRLAAVEPGPTPFDRTLAHLAVGLLGTLGRSAVPARIADLLEPRVDLLVAAERLEHRRRGLAGTGER